MPIFSILRIDHLVLRVEDLERSIAFYRSVLGCEVEKRRDDLGLIHLRAGASLIDLVSVAGPLGRKGGAAAEGERRNLDHFCLRIDPFDQASLTEHLAQVGLSGLDVQIRFGAEGNGPSLYICDPDGNTVELKGPPDAGESRGR
jgi:glyoxylase I family protein